MSENCGELIISAEDLAGIRGACQRRAAELAREAATAALQVDTIAPESPQNVPTTLSVPLPIPLASAFWQALLYGSRDALVSSTDANTGLRLVAHELSTHCNGADFIETIRADALRKALSERFGAKVWDVMNKLWRAAPASPGAPVPNEDQSQASPGVRDCPRSMAARRREFQLLVIENILAPLRRRILTSQHLR
jgi:hypothetical protein